MLCRSAMLSTQWRAAERAHFDVCVIGGGPAGLAAALRAVDYGKRVCVVERARIGGADLWDGTLPSKSMWQFANFLSRLRGSNAHRLYGTSVEAHVDLDEQRMWQCIDEVSTKREAQMRAALDAAHVQLFFGNAMFASNTAVQLTSRRTCECRELTADYFCIATGARPCAHPFAPVDGTRVVNSDHILRLPVPRSLVVVGAGPLGCEFASIYTGLGMTRVHLVDKAARILPAEDDDVAMRAQQQMRRAGVVIHHDSVLYDMQPCSRVDAQVEQEEGVSAATDTMRRDASDATTTMWSGVQYTLWNKRTGALATRMAQRALVTIGRRPSYDGLGLENTTVQVADGRIVVDEHGKSVSAPHIYAVGDAVSRTQLVSLAEAQGKQAIDRIYGTHPQAAMQPARTLGVVSYLTRTVSAVGRNEKECRTRNIAYIAATIDYGVVSRPVAADNTDGFLKVIVSADGPHMLLGVRAVGMTASTLVNLGTLAIQHGYTVHDLVRMQTAYPAVSQAFQECLRAILAYTTAKGQHTHTVATPVTSSSSSSTTSAADATATSDAMTMVALLQRLQQQQQQQCLRQTNCAGVTVTEWAPPHYERGAAYQASPRP